MRFVLASAALALLLVRPLFGDESKPVELTIHARAIETPVLKYRLFPAEAEIKAGDAVPILLRLPWEQTQWMNEVFPKLQEWESRPLDAPEWKSSGGVLPERFFSEMKRAAFRREAHWEYPIGETSSVYLVLLPDVHGLRGFLGRGLAARIRYHLSRGELDQARDGILIGLANARHLAQTPFYVNQLIALAIHQAMLDRTAELISQTNSPNLYWALSTLPDSLIELGRAASLESSAFTMTLPAANDLDRPRDRDEWKKMGEQLIQLLKELDQIPASQDAKQGDSTQELLASWAKAARDELPDLLNMSKDKVAGMSDEEASIRWYVYQRLAIDQRTAAVMVLAPREAWRALEQLQMEIKAMQAKTSVKESDFFNPTSVYVTVWSLKRKIQALRIIEAVRHYLAEHDGKLPATLDEFGDLPIPIDPLTEAPFVWRVEGNSAVLKAPALPASAVAPNSTPGGKGFLEYRLRVK